MSFQAQLQYGLRVSIHKCHGTTRLAQSDGLS